MSALLNLAYVFFTEGMSAESRTAIDQALAGSEPSPRRAREGQAQLMGAMELGRR